MRIIIPCICLLILFSKPLRAQYLWADSSHNMNTPVVNMRTMDVQSADLNGDGHPDLVLAIEHFNNRILFNDGTGKFQDVSLGKLSPEHHDSEDIAIADLDGNGWPDIVFAAEDDRIQQVYLNTGSGNFTDVSGRIPNFESNAVLTEDINNDGHPDLIFGNKGQSRLFINDGSANFTDETDIRLPALTRTTQDLALFDANGDGHKDLFMGNENGNCLLINNGSGIFADETLSRLPQGINMETRKVSIADINSDGHPDIFLSNVAFITGKDRQDRLYLNDGNGNFSDITATHFPVRLRQTVDAFFNDVNNDGYPDLITGHMDNLMPGVYINDGSGRFTENTSLYMPPGTNGNNITMHPGDFNNDGHMDMYIGGFMTPDRLMVGQPPSLGTGNQTMNYASVQIVPNPICNEMTILYKFEQDRKATLTFTNTQGQQVRGQQQFNLNHGEERKKIIVDLPDGIYIVTITIGSINVLSQKLSIRCSN